MRVFIATSCLIAFAVLLLTLGGGEQVFAIPLPADYDLVSFASCSQGDTIVFTYRKSEGLLGIGALALKTGQAQTLGEIAGYWSGIVPSPSKHLFAVHSGTRLLVISDHGELLSNISHPNEWHFNDVYWDDGGSHIFYWRNRDGVTDEETGQMEFTAIESLDVRSGKTTYFPLRSMAANLAYRADEKLFYVSHCLTENTENDTKPCDVDLYEQSGRFVGSRQMFGTRFSANGRYYVPRLHEAGLPWEIYETSTSRPSEAFPELKYGEDIWTAFVSWNPRRDDLLMTSDTNLSGAESDYPMHVWDVPNKRAVMQFKARDVDWSGDGKTVISYRSHRFEFREVR